MKTAQQHGGVGSNGGGNTEAQFRAVVGSAALAVGEWGVGRALALSWLDSLATWVEATGAWAAEEKATLRMDEVSTRGWMDPTRSVRKYVSHNLPPIPNQFIHPAGRPARLTAVLGFLLGEQAAQAILEDEAKVARCLAVFGVHSQQGNRMQRSSAVTGRRFLGPKYVLGLILASIYFSY